MFRFQGHGAAVRRAPAAHAVLLVALAALVAKAWRNCSHTHRRRLSERAQPKPEPLQTWEGEGGRSEPPATSSAAASGTAALPAAS